MLKIDDDSGGSSDDDDSGGSSDDNDSCGSGDDDNVKERIKCKEKTLPLTEVINP